MAVGQFTPHVTLNSILLLQSLGNNSR